MCEIKVKGRDEGFLFREVINRILGVQKGKSKEEFDLLLRERLAQNAINWEEESRLM